MIFEIGVGVRVRAQIFRLEMNGGVGDLIQLSPFLSIPQPYVASCFGLA